MSKDQRDLLEVLKSELEFLEKKGYDLAPRAAWRPQFIFEDSPTCWNRDRKENPDPCSDCVLTQLVPPECRSERTPCRHIPFNAAGETLDSLYRYSAQDEIEQTVGSWLRSVIQQLEDQRKAGQSRVNFRAPLAEHELKGTPLYTKEQPKCANPACPTAFNWTGGGKFFRFRPGEVSASVKNAAQDSPANLHGVRHYWLCERCSQTFTLVYEENYGVVLKLLWPELPVQEGHKELSAA
jgi:hypothetical protein